MNVRGVAFGGELREMRANLLGVIQQERLAARFVGCFERLEIRVERRLCVDDHVLAAGQADDDVGPHAAFVGCERGLFLEVAVFDHSGKLDDALELKLAPAAADTGPLERVDETRRLAAEILSSRVQRRDALHELRTALNPAALGFLYFTIDLLERGGHRRK